MTFPCQKAPSTRGAAERNVDRFGDSRKPAPPTGAGPRKRRPEKNLFSL
jgi:hypothetical protein